MARERKRNRKKLKNWKQNKGFLTHFLWINRKWLYLSAYIRCTACSGVDSNSNSYFEPLFWWIFIYFIPELPKVGLIFLLLIHLVFWCCILSYLCDVLVVMSRGKIRLALALYGQIWRAFQIIFWLDQYFSQTHAKKTWRNKLEKVCIRLKTVTIDFARF